MVPETKISPTTIRHTVVEPKYKIDKNIQIPDKKNKGNSLVNTIALMKVGDSILMKDNSNGSANTAFYTARKKFSKWEFISRRENEGRRFWRIK